MPTPVRVCPLTELKEEEGRQVAADGREIAVFRVGDRVYAFDNTCPHQGGPLSEGMIDGTQVICPWHAWVFDMASGQCPVAPQMKIDTFPTRVENGDVFVDV